MDINDNQQVNTFLKGMNTDVSDMMLDPQLYRYAENLRLITDTESNSGELRLIEGTESLKEFENFKTIYLGSIHDYAVAILWNEISSWKIMVAKDSELKNWRLIFGECTSKIWNEEDRPHISAVLNYESDDNVKLYFVDDTGKHGIMSINIATEYSKNELNISTDINYILEHKNTVLPPLIISTSSISGTLKPAIVYYSYMLYNEHAGYTGMSVTSKSLSLYKSDNEGYNATENTNKSVDINISPLNSITGFSRIRIYRITIVENGLEPLINLIYDGSLNDILNNENIITDRGNNINLISIEEFLQFNLLNINPKIICSKNNYLFAGNIIYSQDVADEKFKNVVTKAGSQGSIVSYELKKDTAYLDVYGNVYRKDLDDNIIKDDIKSFKHGETYRFGIIFYDENGIKTSVKYIDDITIPNFSPGDLLIIKEDSYYREGLYNSGFGVEYALLYLNKISYRYKYYYITFNVRLDLLDVPCSGYEIVRCVRTTQDSRILTQGIVGKCVQQGSTKYILNPGFITMLDFEWGNWKSNDQVFMFASPECAYLPDDMINLFDIYKNSLKLESVYACLPFSYRVHNDLWWDTRYSFMSLGNSYEKNSLVFGMKSYTETINDSQQVTKYKITWNEGRYLQSYSVLNLPNITYSFNLILPGVTTTGLSYIFDGKVDDFVHVESPKYDSFSNGVPYVDGLTPTYTFLDNPSVIGDYGYEFMNWSIFLARPDVDLETLSNYANGFGSEKNYPVSTGGNLFLLKLSSAPRCITPIYCSDLDDSFGIFLTNIINRSVSPYGGTTEFSIKNSTFYEFGDFSTENNINVRSGDAYPSVFIYNAAHLFLDVNAGPGTPMMGTVYIIPLESNIDLRARYGQLFNPSDSKFYAILDYPCQLTSFSYTQTKPAYQYNTAYNGAFLSNPKYSSSDILGNQFRNRIHYSDNKTSNEILDSWLNYRSVNYIDVDNNFGLITQIDTFKDKLLFWQENAFGIISSNERNIILNTDGAQLILGTGDVLLRYDYVSTIYGMKYGQFANVQSDNSEYWWDEQNREILLYTSQSIPSPISTTKGVKLYLKSEVTDVPHLMYDNKYKEVIFHLLNNECISYSEQLLAFTSIYTLKILHDAVIGNRLIITNGPHIDLWNSSGNSSRLFGTEAHPMILFVINKNNTMVKTFDIQTFGGRFYGGNAQEGNLNSINIKYKTPLKQFAEVSGNNITNREYDFRLDIPRERYTENGVVKTSEYGGRLRGKTMLCELSSSSNSTDFSLQYIITKYRISWS